MDLLAGITDMFDSIQLIPASSGFDMHSAQKDRAHLPNIKKDTGVEYRDMLFFDDESPNIVKVCHLEMASAAPVWRGSRHVPGIVHHDSSYVLLQPRMPSIEPGGT